MYIHIYIYIYVYIYIYIYIYIYMGLRQRPGVPVGALQALVDGEPEQDLRDGAQAGHLAAAPLGEGGQGHGAPLQVLERPELGS